MNIVKGELLDREQSLIELDKLNEAVIKTLSKRRLSYYLVIDACDILSNLLSEEEHLPILLNMGLQEDMARQQLAEVKIMLSKQYLYSKIKKELGENYQNKIEVTPLDRDTTVTEQICPLGVLLHIAAGNADGLPVFSVIEGLLTGNINILKMPGMDDGISGQLLMELIRIEPVLSEYIYVFDYPSQEIELIKKMADAADAIVVWGSDIAINAVRQFAKENTKIIEWGHKVSFAYVANINIADEELEGLAQNICQTDQLLCNSCQGIFIDTDDMNVIFDFCERFLEILNRVSNNYPQNYDIGIKAQITLQLRNEKLDSIFNEKRLFKGEGGSLTASSDSEIESSMMFRNCWVKRLPRNEIIRTLKEYKNHLQTVGLLCDEKERYVISELFAKTGVTRITRAKDMSANYCGAPHDGEYALRRYTKIVSFE